MSPQPPPKPENRRAHPRFATSLSVEIYTGEDAVPGIAKNLSLGGVGIATPSPLPAQAQIGISMFLVEDGIEDERTPPVNLRGQVCWCTPADTGGFIAGIRFGQLQPDEAQRIQLFLARLTGAA